MAGQNHKKSGLGAVLFLAGMIPALGFDRGI
jgi:hypothetical protein